MRQACGPSDCKPGGRRHAHGLAGPPIDRPRLARRGLARRNPSARPPHSVATLRRRRPGETAILRLISALQKIRIIHHFVHFHYINPQGGGGGVAANAREGGEGRRAAAPSPPSRPRVARGSFDPRLRRPSVQHWGRAEPRFL